MGLYTVIDKVPELPYFTLALFFIITNPAEISLHVIAWTFFYMLVSLIIGISLKYALKTRRPARYECLPLAKYDIPSLHSMIAAGAIPYSYHIRPEYAYVMAPLSLLYMHSRLRISCHTLKAVLSGAALGLLLGSLFGSAVWQVDLNGYEGLFTLAFFTIPLSMTVFRIEYIRKSLSKG
jgi:membrane-associated phospholipid phosphatase